MISRRCRPNIDPNTQTVGHATHIQAVIEQADDVLKRRALEKTPFGITIADVREEDDPLVYANEGCRASFPEATLTIAGTLPEVRVRTNDLLGSVFHNLLTNAVRHNDAENPEVVVAGAADDDEVFITVSDNGPGITAEDRSRLFERGWRGQGSEGTGIGLYIARKLVTSYGGDLSLDTDGVPADALSRDRGGATFVVRLPLVDEAAAGTA